MSTLNFETSVASIERQKKKQPKMVITIDGREMKVRFPKETRVLLAQSAARKGDFSRFLDLMLEMFPSEEDQDYLMSRIDDPDDPFDIADPDDPMGEDGGVTLYVIFLRIMEEMSARPTGSPSGSSRSSSTTGRTSTAGARVKAKRRATSPSTGS